MKHTRSVIGVPVILAMGLMFLGGAAQAQTMEHPGKTMERPAKAFISDENDTDTHTFKIAGKEGSSMAGMMCDGCTARVRTALEGVDGVVSVPNVDLATQTATVIVSKKSQALDNIPAAVEEVNFVATLMGEEVEAGKVTPDESKGGLLNRIRSLLRI